MTELAKKQFSNQSAEEAPQFEWPDKDQLYSLTLPSGITFLVKPLPSLFWTFYGKLPSYIAGLTYEELLKSEGIRPTKIEKPKSIEEGFQHMELVAEIAKTICVKPKIVAIARNEDEVSAMSLTNADFGHLYAWSLIPVGGEAQSAINFRQK